MAKLHSRGDGKARVILKKGFVERLLEDHTGYFAN